MVRIRCETAKFNGVSTFRCHRCSATTALPSDCAVLLMVYPRQVVMWDAETGTVLHKCRPVNRILVDVTA